MVLIECCYLTLVLSQESGIEDFCKEIFAKWNHCNSQNSESGENGAVSKVINRMFSVSSVTILCLSFTVFKVTKQNCCKPLCACEIAIFLFLISFMFIWIKNLCHNEIHHESWFKVRTSLP